ncbi:MAG: hypothetical protein V3V99_03520 [candidate division Zixibacteria bacterium]
MTIIVAYKYFYPYEAVKFKQQILDEAVWDNLLVFAPHFPFPGLGRLSQTKTGWSWQAFKK